MDNSIDEAIAGFCDKITVIINKDNSITNIDNGRGIPVGIHPKMGIPTVRSCSYRSSFQEENSGRIGL